MFLLLVLYILQRARQFPCGPKDRLLWSCRGWMLRSEVHQPSSRDSPGIHCSLEMIGIGLGSQAGELSSLGRTQVLCFWRWNLCYPPWWSSLCEKFFIANSTPKKRCRKGKFNLQMQKVYPILVIWSFFCIFFWVLLKVIPTCLVQQTI